MMQVRLHCFYYLLPVARGGIFATGMDSQEPDTEVLKLIKDLATIDEALSNTLQPRKCKVRAFIVRVIIRSLLLTRFLAFKGFTTAHL